MVKSVLTASTVDVTALSFVNISEVGHHFFSLKMSESCQNYKSYLILGGNFLPLSRALGTARGLWAIL